jgi:hypothetical protein
MRYRILALFVFLLSAAPAAFAQEAAPIDASPAKPSLQQRLMPDNAAALLAPAQAEVVVEAREVAPAANMAPSGTGTGLMIAGAALFVAGLIVGDDAGTLLAVTGAAIGAYGLYLYFR